MSVFGRSSYDRAGNSMPDHRPDADYAERASAGTRNDLYEGRVTDEDLASSDGKCLGERDEWNLAKIMRRGKWEASD